MNFSKPDWIFELSTGVTIKRIVDGNEFVITGDGVTATINGFPITAAEYSKVLEGAKINITADGKEVVLEVKDKKVMFDGKPFSDGENISTESNTVRKIYSKESLSLQIPGHIIFAFCKYSKVLEVEDIIVKPLGNKITVDDKEKTVMFNGKAFSKVGYVTMESNTVRNPMHNFMKLENFPGLKLYKNNFLSFHSRC